jgi:hypothetical protein
MPASSNHVSRRALLTGAAGLAVAGGLGWAGSRRVPTARLAMVRAGLRAEPPNLLRNADFSQCTVDGIPDHWGTDAAATIGDISPHVEVLDAPSPVRGARVLRLTNPADGFDLRWMAEATRVPSAQPHCLSAWLRSRTTGTVVMLKLGWGDGRRVAATNQWTRYHVVATPTAESQYRRALESEFRIMGAGQVEVCAPQLEQGAAPSDFETSLADDSRLPTLPWPDDRVRVEPAGGRPYSARLPLLSGIFVERPAEASFRDVAAHGFNVVSCPITLDQPGPSSQEPGRDFRSLLDAAQAHHLAVVPMLVYERARDVARLRDAAAELATSVSGHAALAGWLYADEPSHRWNKPPWTALLRMHGVLSRATPGLPVFLTENRWAGRSGLVSRLSDLGAVDVYPIGRFTNALQALDGELGPMNTSCATAAMPTAVWLQLYGYQDAAREPLPAEVRAMAWLAFIQGVRAVFFWAYRPSSSTVWNTMRTVNEELRALQATATIWHQTPARTGVTAGSLHFTCWRSGTRQTAVVCNIADAAVSGSLATVIGADRADTPRMSGAGITLDRSVLRGRRIVAAPYACASFSWEAP